MASPSLSPTSSRARALSHKFYLAKLQPPTEEERQHISAIQSAREEEISLKYQDRYRIPSTQEQDAATKIQKAYRGHRVRRESQGLTLDPSSRWVDIMKEWRFRTATVPQYGPGSAKVDNEGHLRAPSDAARMNWQRVGQIAGYAGAGESPARSPEAGIGDRSILQRSGSQSSQQSQEPDSMLMDMRYFLEMVDQKHRYGTNLLVYHEEWLRSNESNQNFFYWLDRGDGRSLSLPGCSREKLEHERIRYLSKDERKDYLVKVDTDGKLRWAKNDELITTSIEQFKDSMKGIVPKNDESTPTYDDEEVKGRLAEGRQLVKDMVRRRSQLKRQREASNTGITSSEGDSDSSEYLEDEEDRYYLSAKSPTTSKKRKQKHFHVSPATILNHLLRATIRPGTWIYVSDTVGRLFVGIKSSGAFQHASFLSGARISSAGSIGIENGQLTYLSPLSGHYRPTTQSFKTFLKSLSEQGVDLSDLRVSKAFQVLLSIEYYGKTKQGVKNVVKHKKDDEVTSPGEHDRRRSEELAKARATAVSARDKAEEHDEMHEEKTMERRRGLSRLMADLKIRHKSDHDRTEAG